MNEAVRREVKAQLHYSAHYSYENVYLQLHQVPDPNYPLSYVQDKHLTKVTEYMRRHGLDYCHAVTTVFFITDTNPPETSQRSGFQEVCNWEAVKEGHCPPILDGCHCSKLVRLLNPEGYLPWTISLLGMLQIICRWEESFKQAEAIELRKLSNSKTAIVRIDTSFWHHERSHRSRRHLGEEK